MANIKTRKRFGQHFLQDQNIIHNIISALVLSEKNTVVEIGPGKGALTLPLLAEIKSQARNIKVITLELDRDLIAGLNRTAEYYKNLEIIQGDVLNFDFNSLSQDKDLILLGNLPYNISTPLLFYLLPFKKHITEMVFMLQKEVVDRLCAQPNSPDYGRLSVMIQHDFETELLFDVPPSAFNPPPKVDSAVVRLMPKADIANFNYDFFSDIVREAFQHRRKILRHVLHKYYTDEELELLGISPQSRAGELSVKDFEKLAMGVRKHV